MKREVRLLEDDDYDLTDELPPSLDIDDIRVEAKLQGREYSGKFSGKGVRLAPDVAKVFRDSDAVNEALRTVIRVMKAAQDEHSKAA